MNLNKLKKEIIEDKSAKQHLEQIAGPLALEIIKMYNTDKTYSPEEIASKTKKKITNIRATLNSLHYRGIACYKRIRNENNLFDYFWEIKFKKIIEIIIEHETESLNQFDDKINQQHGRDYFYCPKKCVEEPFEVAVAYNFKCPNCNKPLIMQDSKKQVTVLKRKRAQIARNIKKLESIMVKIEDKTSGYICD